MAVRRGAEAEEGAGGTRSLSCFVVFISFLFHLSIFLLPFVSVVEKVRSFFSARLRVVEAIELVSRPAVPLS